MSGELSDLQALEHFVAENDALLELETRIGRFNIFDALGIVNAELRHSNFLAWLLDPGESHGLGGLFLRAVLMDLLRQTPANQRLFSPIKLDGGDLRGIEIRREWRNIDLLITCDDPSFVIAIENKIASSEHSNQLARYQETVNQSDELSKYRHQQFVYLTKEGHEPSEAEWTIYSYADLYRVLNKMRNVNGEQMGDDVRTFLDHYLRLIGSRFMDDPDIVALCKEIYKNHRQAIDLIVENSYSGAAGFDEVYQLIKENPLYEIIHSTSRSIVFVPKALINAKLPPRRKDRSHPRANYWFDVTVYWGKRSLYVEVVVGTADDSTVRRSVIESLVNSDKDTGLATGKRSVTDQWTRLRSKTIQRYESPSDTDEKKLLQVIPGILAKWHPGLENATDVLKTIFD